jgi:DNA repair photolyase
MSGSLPFLTAGQRAELRPELRDVIEYRKSGLSLNHIIGCPLDCAYCVRHLFANFPMKTPRALLSDEEAVARLVTHPYFQAHTTPIQIFNRATDPMLPGVKPHTFEVLRLLDQRELTNHVLVITRWRIEKEDCAILNSYQHLRLTLLVTYSGIRDRRIEPVDSTIAVESLTTSFRNAGRYRVILYWRPIVPGLNDSDVDLASALERSRDAHATVFTGLFFRDEIRDYFRSVGLPEPYDETGRRKILPEALEQRILRAFRREDGTFGPLFRKTSCAVCYAHELPDYNGHYGIRELCDICPAAQLRRCASAFTQPPFRLAAEMATGLGGSLVEINGRAVVVSGLNEPPRYLMQHSLGYQVHDVAKPHRHGHHGRADIGWMAPPAPEGTA